MKTKPMKNAKTAQRATAAAPLPLRIKSILVPIDFSPPSKRALECAGTFARQFKAKLTLLHVVEPVGLPEFAAAYPLMVEDDRFLAATKSELERLARTARVPRGSVAKILVRFGRSFHEIADAARTGKVDLIIISTHGYTGLKHVVLGSTAERVVRHAPCPVLVVR